MVGSSFRRPSVQVRLPSSVQRTGSSNLLGRANRPGDQQSAWEEMTKLARKTGQSGKSAVMPSSSGSGGIGPGNHTGFVAMARSRALSGGTASNNAQSPQNTTNEPGSSTPKLSSAVASPPSIPPLSSLPKIPAQQSQSSPREQPGTGFSVAMDASERVYLSPRVPNRSKAPDDSLFAMPGAFKTPLEPTENVKSDVQDRKIFTKPMNYLDEQLSKQQEGSFIKKSTSSSKLKRSATINPMLNVAEEDKGAELHNFAEIVDMDEDEAYEDYISEELCGRLLEHPWFRNFLLVIIILNSVLIGLQTDNNLERKYARYLSGFDTVFLIVFVIEILLKWYNGFFTFWRVGWNVFDFVIVASSLFGPSLSFLSSARVLRVLRVFRAFRTLRSISVLQSLQVIISTIIESLPDMANIMGLLGIVMFIFSVVGVDVFGESSPSNFGTIGISMFTLYKYLTQDGWVSVTQDLRDANMGISGALYSICFMTIGTYVFINLIVGVTVTNLQDAYAEIKYVRRSKHRRLRRRHVNELPIRPLVKINHIQPDQWRKQEPVEKPKFSNITPSNLENYFLVLSAIEDNLVEFAALKKNFEDILNEIKEKNVVESEGDTSDESEVENDSGVLPEDDDETDPNEGPGDILSMMIRRSGAKEEQSRLQKERQEKNILRHRRNMLNRVGESGANIQKSSSPNADEMANEHAGSVRALLRPKSRQSHPQVVPESVQVQSEDSSSQDQS